MTKQKNLSSLCLTRGLLTLHFVQVFFNTYQKNVPGFPGFSRCLLVFSGFPEISHANPVFITLSRSYSYLSSSHYAKCSPGIPQNTLCSPMPTRDCRTFARTEKYAGRHVVAFLQFKFSRKVSFQSFKKTHQKTKLVLNVALALGHLGQSK